MKSFQLIAACVVLSTMLASTDTAQNGGPGRFVPPAPQRRGDNSDSLMREAAREIEKAHDMLQRALPIYHGNRVDAMQDCRDAQRQIGMGIRYDRRNDDDGLRRGRSEGDNQSANRYSSEEVRRSNETLKRAADRLADAKGDLQRARDDYGGHRAAAIRQIDSALSEIRQALRSVADHHDDRHGGGRRGG